MSADASRAQPSNAAAALLRGLTIAIWGAVIHLPTVGLFADPWLVWINCLVWGIVYARKRLALGLMAVQALTVVVAVVGGTLMREAGPYGLLSAFPALLYFVLWMTPVGVITAFHAGGKGTSQGANT